MKQSSSRIQWLVWGSLLVVIMVVAAALVRSSPRGEAKTLPVIGKLPDFELTNQEGAKVSLASLRGKVWIADIIFTRCPGPCASMTKHLADMQALLPRNQPVQIVTLTSDPEYDTPPILKKYAEHFAADTSKWWFLTGDKPEIRRLAVNDFKFTVVERKPEDRTVPDDLFIHSTWFALVDQAGQVRGWTDREGRLHATYESDDPDARAEILSSIKQLLREPTQ